MSYSLEGEYLGLFSHLIAQKEWVETVAVMCMQWEREWPIVNATIVTCGDQWFDLSCSKLLGLQEYIVRLDIHHGITFVHGRRSVHGTGLHSNHVFNMLH